MIGTNFAQICLFYNDSAFFCQTATVHQIQISSEIQLGFKKTVEFGLDEDSVRYHELKCIELICLKAE